MTIKRYSFSILFISLILFGCGTSKKAAQSVPKPQWVLTTPVVPGYYTGVASSIKTVDIDAYKNEAKNRALSNMISSISVNISTNSVLYRFENSAGYAEDFQSSVRTSSKEYLEGYELVDVFDDGIYYWEYYRLSKQKYKEIKAQRIKEATGIALDYYKKGNADKEALSVKSSILHYMKGMEAIKPFWNETLQTEYNGEDIYLGNELFSGVNSQFNSIIIEPEVENITMKKGEDYSGKMLKFTVKNQSGELLAGIPIVFYANKKPLIGNRKTTNSNGAVSYSLSSVPVKVADIQFVAAVDVQAVVNKATNDIKFRKLSKAFTASRCVVNINVDKPSFFVETSESNFDMRMDHSRVKSRVEQLLTESGYPLLSSKEKADYVIKIDCNTFRKGANGHRFIAGIKGEVRIINNKGEIIKTKYIQQVEGIDSNYRKAGIDAYKKLNVHISKKLDVIVESAINN